MEYRVTIVGFVAGGAREMERAADGAASFNVGNDAVLSSFIILYLSLTRDNPLNKLDLGQLTVLFWHLDGRLPPAAAAGSLPNTA
jgi:hypothetical protein